MTLQGGVFKPTNFVVAGNVWNYTCNLELFMRYENKLNLKHFIFTMD